MSLPAIVLDTQKNVPIYPLTLKIRQGDTGDVLNVTLGNGFKGHDNLTNTVISLMAVRQDQTLIKQEVAIKSGNTFQVTFSDAMYAQTGDFERVYFKIGDDSTSEIKLKVLTGTGSISDSGNYISDLETLISLARGYVTELNSLLGKYDSAIDDTITKLTAKMTDFITKASQDLADIKKLYSDSQAQSVKDSQTQREGFDTAFKKMTADDTATFNTITTNFNKVISIGKTQNSANQTAFNKSQTDNKAVFTKSQTDNATSFSDQSDDFESRYVKQNGDFETRFKAKLASFQDDYDTFKKSLTTDVATLRSQLDSLGVDTKALQAKADKIVASLQEVDLSQMATNKADIGKLRTDLTTTNGKFANYTNTTDLNKALATYVLATKLTEVLGDYSKSDDIKGWIATSANQTKEYAAESIKEIVGAAPETLDTIAELAAAVTGNKTLVDTLNGAITSKADKTDVTALSNQLKDKIVTISDADYKALEDAGTVDMTKMYITPEE